MRMQSRKVWLNEKFVPAQIVMTDGKITAIEEWNSAPADKDFGDLRILPGLIDIHCHGYNGLDCNYATRQGLIDWIEYLPKDGVTSFLATSSTAPEANLLESFALISDIIEEHHRGAVIQGIHVEGPQISHEFKGAHNPYLIQKPNVEQFQRYQKAARGNIRLIAIAPEKDDEHQLTRYCVSEGVKVTIGHSGAKFNECVKAMEDGADSFTHTFNGMLGLHHREPGTAGAAMYLDEMYAELIADGVHVHPAVASVLGRVKGKDKLILVTDSVQIKGLKPGFYHMKGRDVTVGEDGCGRLPDGRLAGSSNRMNIMIGNLIDMMHLPEVTAINAATINPAKRMGFEGKGLIETGYDADLCVLNDDYSVAQTYVAGEEML